MNILPNMKLRTSIFSISTPIFSLMFLIIFIHPVFIYLFEFLPSFAAFLLEHSPAASAAAVGNLLLSFKDVDS